MLWQGVLRYYNQEIVVFGDLAILHFLSCANQEKKKERLSLNTIFSGSDCGCLFLPVINTLLIPERKKNLFCDRKT